MIDKDNRFIFESYMKHNAFSNSENSENSSMSNKEFERLKHFINKGPIRFKKPAEKEDYTAQDYAKEMEVKGEGEEGESIYKDAMDMWHHLMQKGYSTGEAIKLLDILKAAINR
jgi:hypothetical protein